MKLEKIDKFTKGWFIGNFEPSLLKTEDFEVAVKTYKKGVKENSHTHKVAIEWTYIAKGMAKFTIESPGVPAIVLFATEGDLVQMDPGEYTSFEAMDDIVSFVVKAPCVKSDKYEK